MKENELYKINSQPASTPQQIAGKVGFITAIIDDRVSITTLNLDGSTNGGGAVEIKYLIPENSAEWKRAYELYNERMALNEKIAETNLTNVNELLEKIGAEYSLTGQQVWEIITKYENQIDQITTHYK